MMPIKAHKKALGEYLSKLNGKPEFSIDSKPELNRLLFGLERQTLTVIGARPSNGKTAFCVDLSAELSKKHRVLYLSLEMTTQEAMFRYLCHTMKVSNSSLRYHRDEHLDKINEYHKILDKENPKLIFHELQGKDWKEITDIMEHLNPKPDIIILDYIQCLRSKGMRRDAMDDYIKNFRTMSIKDDMSVVILSQINRSSYLESKEPTMEGLKESSTLEEHADKVILLHYPCKVDDTKSIEDFKVHIAKNKNGMTGYLDMKFHPSTYTFYEQETREDHKADMTEAESQINWQDT